MSLNLFLVTHFKLIFFTATLFVFIISSIMTWPRFGLMPEGLNRDEAALGYNAYSLLKTGKDEWGIPWPISITSFGDQKLPGYVYVLIPFVATFGLEINTVRLPSMIAGYVVIVAIGLLAIQLSKVLKLSIKLTFLISILSMLCIAISPWHMHFSRVAYESHLALALFCLGFLCYNLAVTQQKNVYQRSLLILTSLLWSATLLTYHSYHIFIPFFVLGLIILDWKAILKLDKIGLVAGVSIAIFTLLLLLTGSVLQGNEVKSRGTLAINKELTFDEATRFRRVLPGTNALYERILFNPFTESMTIIGNNLATEFSGEFFFVKGSNHGDHNPGNGNNIHLFVLPLCILGLIFFWKHKKHMMIRRIFLWLMIALIPAALTSQPRHEIRLATLYPALELVAAVGFIYLCTKFTRWQKYLISTIFIFIVLYSALRTFLFYIYLAPSQTASHIPYHQLADTLSKYNDGKTIIITDSPSSSPYIWYIFDNKIDPTYFQQNSTTYNPSDEGFLHIKSIGNIYFEDPEVATLLNHAPDEKILLIIKPGKLPKDAGTTFQFSLVETVRDNQETSLYEVWRVEKTLNN